MSTAFGWYPTPGTAQNLKDVLQGGRFLVWCDGLDWVMVEFCQESVYMELQRVYMGVSKGLRTERQVLADKQC